MRRPTFAPLAAALAALAVPAAAQLVPGTRAPADAAEAIDHAQALLCTLAAAGRPMPGLNMPLLGGEGYVQLETVPEALAPFVGSGSEQKAVELRSPGDPVWVVHDPRSGRCAILSFTDPSPVEAKLLASLATPGAWKPHKAGAGVDHAFRWKIGKSVRLLTEISTPDSPGKPLVMVVVRPEGR